MLPVVTCDALVILSYGTFIKDSRWFKRHSRPLYAYGSKYKDKQAMQARTRS